MIFTYKFIYLFLVFSPFLGFLFTFIFYSYYTKELLWRLNVISVLISFLLSLIVFYDLHFMTNKVIIIELIPWFSIELLNISWEFLFDSLTIIMILIITFISLIVQLFSFDYMFFDIDLKRFLSFLSLFTFFMLILVTANNLVQMFLGWEGVGLASYLLINFWHTRIAANKAALKAIIINKIGDISFLLLIILVFKLFKSLEFLFIYSLLNEFNYYIFLNKYNNFFFITLFIFIAAVGKSAQIGLHTWLPDAMEGPTPVSALLHAATMVTAGIFLLIRCSPFLEQSNFMLSLISVVGIITTLFAALIGVTQYDIKKVIAYSTCSQLGYMFYICGLSYYNFSIFHLFNHAFFKALLFLSAGSIIHALIDEQDMRAMGGLIYYLPFTFLSMLIGSLNLVGFSFFSGYYSKDLILELAPSYYILATASFSMWIGYSSAILTIIYSTRSLFFTFFGFTNAKKFAFESMHESSFFSIISLFLLSLGSLFSGYFFVEMFLGLGSSFWVNSLMFNYNLNYYNFDFEDSNLIYGLLPLIFSFLFSGLFIVLYNKYYIRLNENVKKENSIYYHIIKKWDFNLLINNNLVWFIFYIGYFITFKYLDKGLIEYLGPTFFKNSIENISFTYLKNMKYIQSIFFMLIGLLIFLNLIFILVYFSILLYNKLLMVFILLVLNLFIFFQE